MISVERLLINLAATNEATFTAGGVPYLAAEIFGGKEFSSCRPWWRRPSESLVN